MEPTSDRFNADYANRTSIRPSVGGVQQPRNVEVIHRKMPSKGRGRKVARTSGRVAGRVIQATGKVTGLASKGITRAGAALSSTGLGAIVGVPLIALGATGQVASKGVELAGKGINKASGGKTKKRPLGKKSRLGKKSHSKGSMIGKISGTDSGRIRAIKVTMRIFWPMLTLYLFVFLPLGIIGIITAGMKMAVDSFFSKNVTASDAGFFTRLADAIINLAAGAVNTVTGALDAITTYLFDFNITTLFDPTTYFLITYTLLLFVAMLQLLIIYLVYKLARLEPIGGKGSGLKHSMLLLAIIGYSIPLLNIIPWVGFWLLAIIKNPK